MTDLFPAPRRSLLSLPFFVITLFLSLSCLRFNYFLAEISVVSDFHFHNPSLTAKFGTVVTFLFTGGLPIAFLCGVIVDKLRSNYAPEIEKLLKLKESDERNKAVMWNNARPAAIVMYIYAIATLVLSCLILIPVEAVYYVNFVFFLIMRGFLFTTNSITLFSLFPVAQFGTVFGVESALTGVITCLQYALLKLQPTYSNICALVIALLIFIPPTIIFIMSSKSLKRISRETVENAKPSSEISQLDESNNIS